MFFSELIPGYLDIKYRAPARHPDLPDTDTGKCQQFPEKEQSAERTSIVPHIKDLLFVSGRNTGSVILIEDMQGIAAHPCRNADKRKVFFLRF